MRGKLNLPKPIRQYQVSLQQIAGRGITLIHVQINREPVTTIA